MMIIKVFLVISSVMADDRNIVVFKYPYLQILLLGVCFFTVQNLEAPFQGFSDMKSSNN